MHAHVEPRKGDQDRQQQRGHTDLFGASRNSAHAAANDAVAWPDGNDQSDGSDTRMLRFSSAT